MNFKISRAYTLAEVVIVMLIIAVVVAISIRAAKTKMDNIITYNYYAAYETMRNVTKDLLLNPNEDDYTAYMNNTENLSFWNKIKYSNAVWAIEKHVDQTSDIECKLNGYSGSDGKNCYINVTDLTTGGGGLEVVLPGGSGSGSVKDDIGGSLKDDNTGTIVDNDNNGGSGNNGGNNGGGSTGGGDNGDNTGGTDGDNGDNTGGGSDNNGGDNGDNTGDVTGGDNNGGTTGSDPTGGSTGNGGTVCPEGYHWSAENAACIADGRTIPKKDFCPNFEKKVNSKALTSSDTIIEFCKGDSISDSETDFSSKKPDIILRNGMRLYNLSQPYVEIDALKDGAAGAIFIDADGNEIDTNKNGYIVYADIDGLKGESKLWVDVFPFYITLSGQVIPAYPADGSAGGGNDKFYLATSLSYEKIDGSTRTTTWLTKSVSYQESACKSGYIDENTDYCGDFTKENACKEENIDCRIKYIKPSPFFK